MVLEKYTFTTLASEAKEINDNSEWVGGLAYHAASSAVAFLRNLAESYGYSTEIDAITNKTPRQAFLEVNKYKYIQDKDVVSVLATNSTASDAEKEMASVSVDSTSALTKEEKRKVLQSIGKDGGMANTKSDYENFTSGHLENYRLTHSNPMFGTNQFSVYPDYRTGNASITLFDVSGTVIRNIDVPGIIDKYPILSNEKLNEYLPYMKQLLYKFLEIYQGNAQDALSMNLITSEIADQISYLTNKNLIKKTDGGFELKIDDKEFMKHLVELNNGSTHWLALKAILNGFDASFTTDDIIAFTGDRYWPAMNKDEKTGINDMGSILDLMAWGGKGRLTLESQDYDTKYDLALIPIDQTHFFPLTFVAGKTSEELFKINNASDSKIKEIGDAVKQYNIDNPAWP